jgi:hypothetical protein
VREIISLNFNKKLSFPIQRIFSTSISRDAKGAVCGSFKRPKEIHSVNTDEG